MGREADVFGGFGSLETASEPKMFSPGCGRQEQIVGFLRDQVCE